MHRESLNGKIQTTKIQKLHKSCTADVQQVTHDFKSFSNQQYNKLFIDKALHLSFLFLFKVICDGA